jgi:uncharacterized protein (DUF342 family)
MVRPVDFSFGFDVKLEFDESCRQVKAHLIPSLQPVVFSKQLLQTRLREAMFSEYYLFEDRLDDLCGIEADLREKGQKIYAELLKRASQVEYLPTNVRSAAATDDDESAVAEADEEDSDLAGASERQTVEMSVQRGISAVDVFALLRVEPVCVELAELRDAEIEITTSEDDLIAWLTLFPPYGGKPASKEAITAALKAKAIKVQWKEDAVDAALKSGKCDNVVVATGVSPQKGRDSSFKVLVEEQVSRGPVIDEKGVANYLDINHFVVLDKGHKLMRREKPSAGKAGMDLFGRVIPAEQGDWLPFFGGIEGAEVSPDDSNLLIASQKGHPIIYERGVSVDPVLQLTNVSLATGNVNYDGSVLVKQDVADGLKVEVTGDLIVEGVVGKATIIAGNNVIIRQGLIGGVPAEDGQTHNKFGASVTAQGSVSVHFTTMAKIWAGKKIGISEYASHCDLYAKESILIGEGSGKGSLIGGHAQAFDLVAAKTLGSPGSTMTHIRVGAEPNTLDKFRRVSQLTRQKQALIDELHDNLHKFKLRARHTALPPQMLEKLEQLNAQLVTLENDLAKLQQQDEQLKDLLVKSKKSKVVGRLTIHQNVVVSILGSSLRIKEDCSRGTFYFELRQVQFKH